MRELEIMEGRTGAPGALTNVRAIKMPHAEVRIIRARNVGRVGNTKIVRNSVNVNIILGK